jgi:protein gp37
MGNTRIEWTEVSWNPVTGCSKVSPGCKNCYAERMAKRLKGRFAYPRDEPFKVTLHPERLQEPFGGKGKVFVCSMGDLFHEEVPFYYVAKVFDICLDERCRKHTFLVLTKRPERIKKFWKWLEDFQGGEGEEYWSEYYDFLNITKFYKKDMPNIWFGVSIENQKMAEKRIPILFEIPAAKKFVSCEPLLGPIDLERPFGQGVGKLLIDYLDWVIVGGESGPGARPMHPNWVRSIKNQCVQNNVPFFFKQWGAFLPRNQFNGKIDFKYKRWGTMNVYGEFLEGMMPLNGFQGIYPDFEYLILEVGKKRAGRELDGKIWDQCPIS